MGEAKQCVLHQLCLAWGCFEWQSYLFLNPMETSRAVFMRTGTSSSGERMGCRFCNLRPHSGCASLLQAPSIVLHLRSLFLSHLAGSSIFLQCSFFCSSSVLAQVK